jgi:hypothetical protein
VSKIQSLTPEGRFSLLLDKSYPLQEVELLRLGPRGYLFKPELGEPECASRLYGAMLMCPGFQYLGEAKHCTAPAN